MAQIDSTTAPDDARLAARLAVVKTATPEETRAMLAYISGHESRAFEDALVHIALCPAPTPEDDYTPRHSASHREGATA